MTQENEKWPDDMPIELQLDLLVDEELPEERRSALLRSLDKMPARWRELSIRFLERQVERKSARQLITTGKVAPAGSRPDKEIPVTLRFPKRGWFTPMHITGIAAGLLAALGVSLVIVHESRHENHANLTVATNDGPEAGLVTMRLPSSVVGTQIPVQVSVVNVPQNSGAMAFFPDGASDVPGSRRSVVIQPDGLDNALIIPVKNLQVQ